MSPTGSGDEAKRYPKFYPPSTISDSFSSTSLQIVEFVIPSLLPYLLVIMRLAQSVNSSSLLLPEGTYIYKLEPIGPNLAIISSDDSLRVLDPETLDLSTTIKESHDGVTCLASRDNILFTAGRDGHIRCWDCRTGGKSMQIKNGK